ADAGAQVAQCGRRQVVVGVRERGASLVGDRVHPSRATTTAVRGGTRLAFGQQPVGNQRVEVPPDRGWGQIELRAQGRGRLRTTLEDQPGNGVSGAVGDFHYTSMTYLASPCRHRAGAPLAGTFGGSSAGPC